MPVALKLSKRFYDTIGQEVANEFVDALNAVDTSYRAEFRDLFAAHFGQLRAEVDSVATGLRADMAKLESGLRTDMAKLESGLRADMAKLESGLRAEFLTALVTERSKSNERLIEMERRLLFWMLGFWLAALPAMAGLVFALRQLGWL